MVATETAGFEFLITIGTYSHKFLNAISANRIFIDATYQITLNILYMTLQFIVFLLFSVESCSYEFDYCFFIPANVRARYFTKHNNIP